MDLGTGMIIFSTAAASAPVSNQLKSKFSKKKKRYGIIGHLLSSQSLVLSVIGLVKFYIHRSLNYQ